MVARMVITLLLLHPLIDLSTKCYHHVVRPFLVLFEREVDNYLPVTSNQNNPKWSIFIHISKSKLYFVLPYLVSPSPLLYKHTLVLLVYQSHSRVIDMISVLNLGRPFANFHLLNDSLTLLKYYLKGRAVIVFMGLDWISTQHKYEISLLCFEDGRVEVELNSMVEGHRDPFFSFNWVYFRRGSYVDRYRAQLL